MPLLLEHCDAEMPGRAPQKGWLGLEQEIDALHALAAPIGIVLNWGRSAIEFQDADRVVEHVRMAHDAGLLKAIVFSGASDQAGAYGEPWQDGHLPFSSSAVSDGDPVSLMNEERTRAALSGWQPDWVGAKLSWRSSDGSEESRVRMLADSAALLERIVTQGD